MNRVFFWSEASTPETMSQLLRTLSVYEPRLKMENGDCELRFRSLPPGELEVELQDDIAVIGAGDIATAARGIGLALAGLCAKEVLPFRKLGVMLDCSRNKVFTVSYLKKYLASLAMSGYNTVMLYLEDTYCLSREPFFGYMRGGYSLNELRELDAFSKTLGIELIACIQTLGHLAQYLRWQFAAEKVTDTATVLLVDAPETYELIERMLAFWREALSSRRIHIGMDETHDLGRGRFLDRHGYERNFDIFNRHLRKVNDLCRKYGFEMPTIWSDMYFRMGDPENDYYGDALIPPDVQRAIPENIQLCYWDYYHDEPHFYEHYIDRHRQLSSTPLMVASGIWTWNKFWYDHNFTWRNAAPCIEACRKKKVEELIFTMWGDDGAFCLYNSALAGTVYTANLAWGEEDPDWSVKLYHAVTHENYDRCIALSRIESEGAITPEFYYYFPSAQLWDDPLLAIYCKGVSKLDPRYPERMLVLFREIQTAYPSRSDDSIELQVIMALIAFLERKMRFRLSLELAWKEKDRALLQSLSEKILPEMVALLDEFDRLYRIAWLECAKPFGLEVIQIRNAGQRARLLECGKRLADYLNGKIKEIPELDSGLEIAPVGYSRPSYRYIAAGGII